jgi:hypothetical protein
MALMLLFSFKAHAEKGVNIGISLAAGVFEVQGANEKFSGSHSSGAGATVTKKSTDEGENAEGLFGIGSLFLEKTLGDKLAIGIDYVPTALESETTENTQTTFNSTHGAVLTEVTNTVSVDFEDLTTVYAMLNLNEMFYVKAGFMTVDVITNDKLNTGSTYGNTDLDGTMFAIGFAKDLDNGAFVRLEGSVMEFDGTTLTSQVDSAKSVSVDGIEGYGAKLSVGKSF